jgi:hypothetical protein
MFGASGFTAASGIEGIASSASATAAAANLAAGAMISPALAGTAAVIASMASALTSLPLFFKRLARKVWIRIAAFTSSGFTNLVSVSYTQGTNSGFFNTRCPPIGSTMCSLVRRRCPRPAPFFCSASACIGTAHRKFNL